MSELPEPILSPSRKKNLLSPKYERIDGNGGSDVECSSPDSHCVICLGDLQDKSFTDSCLHHFCFLCLVKWSKVKAVCPLCKQPFKSILHKIQSNGEYEQYNVPREGPSVVLSDFMSYRFMVDVFNSSARDYFVHLLDHQTSQDQIPVVQSSPLSRSPLHLAYRDNNYIIPRRVVYRRNLWVRPLPDVTGRFRECSAMFYRDNPAQLSRLAPWVTREVQAVLPERDIISRELITSKIMRALRFHDINSPSLRQLLLPHLRADTDHFIHELTAFARSVFDITGFDSNARYGSSYATDILRCLIPPLPPSTSAASTSTEFDSDIEVVDVVPTEPRSCDIIYISDSDSDVVMLPSEPEVLVVSSDDEPPPRIQEYYAGIMRPGYQSGASTSGCYSGTSTFGGHSGASTSGTRYTSEESVRSRYVSFREYPRPWSSRSGEKRRLRRDSSSSCSSTLPRGWLPGHSPVSPGRHSSVSSVCPSDDEVKDKTYRPFAKRRSSSKKSSRRKEKKRRRKSPKRSVYDRSSSDSESDQTLSSLARRSRMKKRRHSDRSHRRRRSNSTPRRE